MWTRLMLKLNAKAAFKKNYVNVVIVSLIFSVISGTLSTSSSAGKSTSFFTDGGSFMSDFPEIVSLIMGTIIVVGIIGIVISIFLLNPLEVGIHRFFIENHYNNPKIGTILFSFKSNYLNAVKTMFIKNVYLFLWSLALVIPGIIKGYSYRLVPFILADNPDMDADAVITLSREMMDGHKLNTFVLDLSFILWYFLAALTFNIAGIFYVYPYKYATNAELYLALKEGSAYGSDNFFNDNNYNNGGYND